MVDTSRSPSPSTVQVDAADLLEVAPTNRGAIYRNVMKSFYLHWHRLLGFSYVLQQVLTTNPTTLALMPIFLPCYESATKLVQLAREELQPKGFLRYAQDLVFIYISYAAVFLLKLLRPELVDCTDSAEVLRQAEMAVKCLEEVSVDATHTPALYAGFLRVLLRSKQGKDSNQDSGGKGDITLDLDLANKLMESQANGRQGEASGQQTSFATLAGPAALYGAAAAGSSADGAQQMEPSASIYQQFITSEANPTGVNSASDGNPNFPSSSWNLDQLGQSGFWENLSMRESQNKLA